MTEELTLKPGGFDLESFISGAVVATDSVEVTSKPGLHKQLQALVGEHAEKSRATESRSKRLAEKDEDLSDLEKRIRDMAAELEGSWVEVEFTTPTPTQRRLATEVGGEVNEAVVAALMEHVGRIRPKGADEWSELKQAGWASVFDAIGSDQFSKVADRLAVLTYGKGVTPGFSQRALSYLETRESSKN